MFLRLPEEMCRDDAVTEAKNRVWINYFTAVVLPNGNIIYPEQGHAKTLAAIYSKNKNGESRTKHYDIDIAYNDMGITDHPLYWLITQTNCIVVDYEGAICPKKISDRQKDTIDIFRKNKFLSNKYDKNTFFIS